MNAREWLAGLGRYKNERACAAPKPGVNVTCTLARGHKGAHVAPVKWSSWDVCSSCGEPTDSLGCVPDLSGRPAHTRPSGCEATPQNDQSRKEN